MNNFQGFITDSAIKQMLYQIWHLKCWSPARGIRGVTTHLVYPTVINQRHI